MNTNASRLPLLLAAAAACVALTACAAEGPAPSKPSDRATRAAKQPEASSTAASSATPTTAPAGSGRVYVAVGASETVGVGADHPGTQAWPRVLHDTALRRTTFVNLGVSGATVGEALAQQLPRALAAQPDVVTVWLAVNDLTHLVPVTVYEQQLQTLLHELRRGGRTTLLVGNMPPVDRMPAYLACLPGATATDVACELPVVPPPAQVRQLVTRYNEAIARVVKAEGAVPVDLTRGRDLTRLTSADGFHPSTAGHRLVAATFAAALKASTR